MRQLTLKQLRKEKEEAFKAIEHDKRTCLEINKPPRTPNWGCECPGVAGWKALFWEECRRKGIVTG